MVFAKRGKPPFVCVKNVDAWNLGTGNRASLEKAKTQIRKVSSTQPSLSASLAQRVRWLSVKNTWVVAVR